MGHVHGDVRVKVPVSWLRELPQPRGCRARGCTALLPWQLGPQIEQVPARGFPWDPCSADGTAQAGAWLQPCPTGQIPAWPLFPPWVPDGINAVRKVRPVRSDAAAPAPSAPGAPRAARPGSGEPRGAAQSQEGSISHFAASGAIHTITFC